MLTCTTGVQAMFFQGVLMLKKILCVFALLWAAVASAAVDVNKATPAELDGIKGIGPSLSGKIVDERKKSNFKDWPDFISRVKGMGDKNAAKFSGEGLTVNGASLKGAGPAAAAAPAAPATVATAATPAVTANATAAASKAAAPAPMTPASAGATASSAPAAVKK
jgi:competence protein ComEA